MADQTVNVANLPDSGSHQRVAFDLMKYVRTYDATTEYKTKSEILNLYRDCLKTTFGQKVD